MANRYYENTKVDGEYVNAAMFEAIEDGFDAIQVDLDTIFPSLDPTNNAVELNGKRLAFDADYDTYMVAATDDTFQMVLGGSEFFRIDSDGMHIYTTGLLSWSDTSGGYSISDANGLTQVFLSGGNTQLPVLMIGHQSGVDETDIIQFINGGAVNGRIEHESPNGVSYNTSSDYRLKENVQSFKEGIELVRAIDAKSYNWTNSGTLGVGFIAHELDYVFPYAVSGKKDAVNEDGSIKAQMVDYGRVTPVLWSAVQNLDERLRKLEG